MKVGKPKSKRVPVRRRHAIDKAAKSKDRKRRKEAKKDPTWRSKIKKDPGIPNLFPYKNKILQEIEDGKRRKEEEVVRRREETKAAKTGVDTSVASKEAKMVEDDDPDALLDVEDEQDRDEAMAEGDSSNPMAALLASATARAADYDPGNVSDSDSMEDDEDASDVESFTSFSPEPSKKAKPMDTSRRAYARTLESLISTSDILLYILDARDPLSTRSPSIEQSITSDPNKRLIYILNKIDLVPSDVLKQWMLHLKRSYPALPLRSSSSAPSAKTFDHKQLTPNFTANNLIKALKSYSASRTSTTVGIIGYPNVGKSSVINALTSRLSGKQPSSCSKRECPVGAEAGVTTALREVKLDSKIKLIDSPGVVFPSSSPGTEGKGKLVTPGSKKDADEQARLVLLNAIPPREINDPVPAVALLLRRLGDDAELLKRLLDVYELPSLMKGGETRDITTDFLVQVARKRGRLGKGGVPNLNAAAQTVISDWRDGRIQGWVRAPTAADEQVNGRQKDQKEIVSSWAEEFSIEGLWGAGADGEAADGDVQMAA